MQKVRTSKGEIKRAMYLHNPSIEVLEIQGEEKELYPPYLVKVRGYEIDYLYDGEQFFVGESDAQADKKYTQNIGDSCIWCPFKSDNILCPR